MSVLDANDNAPIFNPREYSAEAVENWPPGTALAVVMASDADSGANAKIHYELAHGDIECILFIFNGFFVEYTFANRPTAQRYLTDFKVDNESGIVYTTRSLMGLARAHPYELMITATDSGNSFLLTFLSVQNAI